LKETDIKIRAFILLILFGFTWYIIHNGKTVKPVPIKRPLADFPRLIGIWKVIKIIPSSEDVVRMLGVTDYIEYEYSSDKGKILDFYVGYYHAVGVDGAYHSPKNCLPGGGWGTASEKRVILTTERYGKVSVTEMIIQNGLARQVVFYWFQNRGRIIASEYWEKIYLVLDSLLKHRRDGAFVRVMMPCTADTVGDAEKALKEFSAVSIDELTKFLPGQEL